MPYLQTSAACGGSADSLTLTQVFVFVFFLPALALYLSQNSYGVKFKYK